MTKKTKTQLTDELPTLEKNNSFLEQALRQKDIPVCHHFNSKKGLMPCGFQLHPSENTRLDGDTVTTFPKIIQQNGSQLLSASTVHLKIKNKKIAVLFSGGPAAGGHNVVAGIKKILGPRNDLYGVKSGPKGLLNGDLFLISDENTHDIFNLGGFDFLGSDRTKIKTDDQFKQVKEVVVKNKLNGLIVIGGDDSNTNAAFLAEYLFDVHCAVIGVPKTIDGDLQIHPHLPISFGFDTASKVYSEMVGNILQDTPSSRKYWHFVKLMGRSASHVTLEVALQTHPHITLISEEIADKKQSLKDIVKQIANAVVKRSRAGKDYGVVLIPEGLIEFIPELNELIAEINQIVSEFDQGYFKLTDEDRISQLKDKLSKPMAKLFASLPGFIQSQLSSERDSHGNLKVSQIPTEALLIDLVKEAVAKKDIPFAALNHFFGYEGRCGAPTEFDAVFTYNLGLIAGSLAIQSYTGYMASLTDLDKGGTPLAIPLTNLIITEKRDGENTLVIEKSLVDLDSQAFKYFDSRRKDWAKKDLFASPGPIQHWGESAKQLPISVALNQGYSSLKYKIK